MKRLPRGRHDLSPEYIAQNQRERLIAAATKALYEVGYPEVTVGLIGKHAAISKTDFYKHFVTKSDCLDAAFDAGVERVSKCVQGACAAPEDDWAQRVQRAISALLDLFAEQPGLARLVLVEGLRVGRSVRDRHQAAMVSFALSLAEGAPTPVGGAGPEIGEAVVGGIASLLGRQILAGDAERLAERKPELLEFALAPYLGVAEARRIVSAG